MNAKQRIKKLENVRGTDEKKKYICVTRPEDTEYIAKPPMLCEGETFTFKTQEAMNEFFEKRTDIEFLHIQIVYASQAGNDSEPVTE